MRGAPRACAASWGPCLRPRLGSSTANCPAERRGEALADVCGFYVDYRTRTNRDPDAPVVPKKRNWPQLIAITTTEEIKNSSGAHLLDGPRIDARGVETLSCTAQLLRLVL